MAEPAVPPAPAGAWPRPAGSPLRLGVVGANRRGEIADFAHRPDQGVAVVAGVDVTEEGRAAFRRRFREKFGVEPAAYPDDATLFARENLDGVFITSPDHLHEEQALRALARGVAVYLEKPLAITVEGADRILAAAHRARTPLFVGHNMRYMDFTRRMKALVDAGTVGEVKTVWCRHFVGYGGDAYFHDWHADRRRTTSLLLQKGAHDLDIIHWLAGGHTTRAVGMGALGVYGDLPRRPAGRDAWAIDWSADHWPPRARKDLNPVVDVEDLSLVLMTLDNGVLASYQQCHYTPDSDRNYTVIGTAGRLENFGAVIQVWTRRADHYRPEGDITVRADPGSGAHDGADPKCVWSFVSALRGVYDLWTTPQAARAAVAAGCAATASLRGGAAPVDVPPLPAEWRAYDFMRCR